MKYNVKIVRVDDKGQRTTKVAYSTAIDKDTCNKLIEESRKHSDIVSCELMEIEDNRNAN